MSAFGRFLAVVMLACIPLSLFSVYFSRHGPDTLVAVTGGTYAVARTYNAAAVAAGVRPGDTVDVDGISSADRVRFYSPPLYRPFSFPVETRRGRVVVTMGDRIAPDDGELTAFEWIVQCVAITALVLAALVLWRKPSVMTIAFGGYAIGTLYGLATTLAFGFLTGPLFTAVAFLVPIFTGTIPSVALVVFALRFPEPLRGTRGVLVTRIVDGVLLALFALGVVRIAQATTDFNPWLDTAPAMLLTLALLAIVIVRLARARGTERRRMSWVVAGSVISAIGATFSNFEIVGVLPQAPQWITTIAAGMQIALPIAFAYAILRHRVVDIGFAINRTVVYTVITGMLVIAVGAVDWLCGKLLNNTHVSGVVEAAATIALGTALGWLHKRVESAVDRVFFRSRYIAERRIEDRIAALDYATTTDSIDATLVDEALQIFNLTSAAVFRRTEDASFARAAAIGWDSATTRIALDDLLIRTLRAGERTIDLSRDAIAGDGFASGATRPSIAVPIVARHDFLGVALYGYRPDDQALDPEEVAQLERLVAAAAAAYEAVDAAEWRRRALALPPVRVLRPEKKKRA